MTSPEPGAERPGSRLDAVVATAQECGLIPTLAVALGGASVGILLWAGTGARASAAVSAVAFASLAILGTIAAFIIWIRGGTLVAQRTAIPPVYLMRWDAWSWFGITLSLLVFVPPISAPPSTVALTAVLAFGVGKIVTLAHYDQAVRDASLAFVLSRIPVVVLMGIAPFVLIPGRADHGEVPLKALAGFTRWDGAHYLEIARNGYRGVDTAFFPLYPTLIRLLGSLVHSDVIAGLVISNVAFFVALVVMRRLVAIETEDEELAQRAVYYLAIFPTAMFFSALYGESLFLCLSLLFFYALRTQRMLLAGAMGGLAATTRSEGILLLVPYFVDVAAGHSMSLDFVLRSRPLRRRLVFGALFIVFGLLLYMLFLTALTGNPLAFESVQSHWNRHLAPPWVSISLQIARLLSPKPEIVVESAIEFAFAVLAIVLTVFAFRRVPFSQWTYIVLSLLLPLSTASLLSVPRFLIVIFPLFVVLAGWGRTPFANRIIVGLSLPLLGAFALLFGGFYWVS